MVGFHVPCHSFQGVKGTVPQSAPHLCHPLPSPPAPTSPPTLVLLDVQGRVINLQEERARSGHCVTICLLRQGVGKIFAWRDLPLLSSCWNVTPSKLSLRLSVNTPVFVFTSPQYRLLVIRAGVHQQLAAYLLACLRHFINRCQCCYDGAWRSDPHAVHSALRWK